MDATVSQLLLSLLTNAVSAVAERGWDRVGENDPLVAAIAAITDDLAKLPELSDTKHGLALDELLRSPELNGLMRSLYVAGIHHDEPTTEQIQEAFRQAFAQRLPGLDAPYADRLFTILTSGSQRVLSAAAREGDAGAGVALQGAFQRSVKEDLGGIRAMLAELTSVARPTVAEFERWEELYRHQVVVRHGTISPPSTDGADRVPIDDLYVASRFGDAQLDYRHPGGLSERDVLGQLDRTVVLGDPGAGKSTFVQKLVYDLASGRAAVPGGALTPFLITLKDYGAERQRSQISLVDWIERVVNRDYSVGAPAGAVRYLLNSGRALVVFDGLDELLDVSHRRAVSGDVETFAARYFSAPILVTSRRVGYSRAPLDQRRFQSVGLLELDDDQIERYVRNWFALRSDLSEARRREVGDDFLEQSTDHVDDLRANTLMLGLLCNIFLVRESIPPSRPAVYEACALMLFDQWDRDRNIESAVAFEQDLRPVIQHLAYWIYSEVPEEEVSETALLRRTAAFLRAGAGGDQDKARQRARLLLDVCRGRAWVFTDTNRRSDGERLYQFTHRTFLEFFAAEYLVRIHDTPAELGAVLRPHIENGEWDVVAQLAFQLEDKAEKDGASVLLGDLLRYVRAPEDFALSFAARGLGFLRPDEATCALVAKTVTRRTCLEEWELREMDVGLMDPDASETFDKTHCHLIRAAAHNVEAVGHALVDEALAFAESYNRIEPIDRLRVFLDVVAHCDLALGDRRDAEARALWDAVRLRGFAAVWPSLRPYVRGEEYVAHDAFLFGRYTVEDVLDDHGVSSLFARRLVPLYGTDVPRGPVDLMLEGQLQHATRPGGDPLGARDELATLGAVLLDHDAPWDPGLSSSSSGRALRSRRGQRLVPADPRLDSEALFGAFGALAAAIEHARRLGEEARVLKDLEGWEGWVATLMPWIRERCGIGEAAKPDAGVLELDDLARARVAAWAAGDWSAVL